MYGHHVATLKQFLVFLGFVLFPTVSTVGEEHEHICRYCDGLGSGCYAGPIGIELDGEGRRYAPDRFVDILHIKLDVTPDFQRRTVAGTTTITFAPIAKPLEQLRLDAVHLTILGVRSESNLVDHVSTSKDLTIAFDPPIPAGEPTSVEIRYEAQPTLGLHFRTPEMGYPASDSHVWSQGEPHEARYWFPCFDYPNERSSSEVICRVPDDMTVLSNGKKVSEMLDPNSGLKVVHWLQEKPHVSYLICLVAGHFEKLEKSFRNIPLAFYTQPSLIQHAANAFQDTADIMAFFDEEIGVPYPWNKYYQVTVRDLVVRGMENTTLTTLTHHWIFTDETENIRTARRVDAHETVHQWFGNYVTCKDWSHLWLNEGFAVYYAHLYEGHKFGRDAMLYGLYRDAKKRILTEGKDKRPIVFKEYKTAREQFDYRAYPKGSWVLHMLRSQLGPDLFRQCIKGYLERHAFTSVVTEDLNEVIEELSGRSFDPFFDQWVYHARYPDLKVTYRWLSKEKRAKVSVEQTHEVSQDVLLFRFPAKLRFIMGTTAVDHDIEINEKTHDFFVPLPEKPRIVRFDPEYSVLADVAFEKSDEMLFAQLENRNDVIGQLLAAESLASRDTHKSVERLKGALQTDPFFGVRIGASIALRKIHNESAFAALAESLDQPDARVRLQVVEDVGKFYRPGTLDIMKRVLADEKNPAIAAEAIRSLGRFHGGGTRQIIIEFLRSNSFRNELADAAIAAIRMQNEPTYRSELFAVLKDRKRLFTSKGLGNALDALAYIHRDEDDKTEVRQFVGQFLNDPKEPIRIAAIKALGTLRDARSLAVLESLASGDGGERIRDAAQTALKSLQERSPTVPDELVQLRKRLSELKTDYDKLQKDVDDVKSRLGVRDSDEDSDEGDTE